MIDMRLVREDVELVKNNAKKKYQDDKLKLIDELKKKDEEWRSVKYESDNLRAERNKISKEINEAKKIKDEKLAKELIRKAKDIPIKISKAEERTKKLTMEIKDLQSKIPNIISKNVPLGKDEKDNFVARIIGKSKKFGFNVKSHIELIDELKLGDFESSSKVAGTGFYYLEGRLALLNQALLNYARDVMVKKGFNYIETPLMLREEIIDRVTDI